MVKFEIIKYFTSIKTKPVYKVHPVEVLEVEGDSLLCEDHKGEIFRCYSSDLYDSKEAAERAIARK